jgi:hypothetical protein
MTEPKTKWNHIPDNSDNLNKSTPKNRTTTPMYANMNNSIFNETFQNIYNPPVSNKEGFDLFGEDFDMENHPKQIFDTSGSTEIISALYAIRDFILCPIYKSDELIDSGLQNLLAVFLTIECNDASFNIYNNPVQTEIISMEDIIDPQLLYDSRTGFQNMKEGLTSSEIDCGTQKDQAIQNISNYTKTIKEEIYKILFLPVVIHIFYNIYYMFFFKDIFGNRIPFIDIEKDYYEPNLKASFDYFLGIVIKPVTIFRLILDSIASFKPLRKFNDSYPYVTYIILFFIVYSSVEIYNKNIISIIGDLLMGATNPFSIFALIVMIYFFIDQTIRIILPSWQPTLQAQPVSGGVKFLIYMIIKIVINIFIFPFGGYLCVLYFIMYTFFGIYISQEKDVFDVYNDIMDMVFDKIYGLYDPVCGENGIFMWFLQIISKFGVVYLFEITILYILLLGMGKYSGYIDNVNVQSFLLILNITGIFILGIWSFIKYITTVKNLDDKYSVINISKKTANDNIKKERVKNELPARYAEQQKIDKENAPPLLFSKEAEEIAEKTREENKEAKTQKMNEYFKKYPTPNIPLPNIPTPNMSLPNIGK